MTDCSAKRAQTVPLSDLLCFSIYSTSHAFNRVYKPILEDLGLTYPQYLVMLALWQGKEQTVGSLGKALKLESNTLTPLLKRLESRGLITRSRDSQDERQVLVRPTSKSDALRRTAERIPPCIEEATGMTQQDLQELNEKITDLRDKLEQYAA